LLSTEEFNTLRCATNEAKEAGIPIFSEVKVLRKLHQNFAVEAPKDEFLRWIGDGLAVDCIERYGLVVGRKIELDEDSLYQISTALGKVIPHAVSKFSLAKNGVATLSNKRAEDGSLIGADRSGLQWHTDGSFRSIPPKFTALYGVECPPEGADTQFCCTSDILEDFDHADQSFLKQADAVHDYEFYWNNFQKARGKLDAKTKKMYPPITHPATTFNHVTSRQGIYFMSCMCPEICAASSMKSKNLLGRSDEIMNKPANYYSHRWEVGDLLIWDNRSVFHRATEFDDVYPRLMIRTSIAGTSTPSRD